MSYTTNDNLTLFRHEWNIDNPKAKILLVHGLAEHAGRYVELASKLNAAGYAVVSFDQRGNGKSSGVRAHIDSFTQLTSDLDMIAKREHIAGLPYILLSHSLGGLITSRYLIDYTDHPFDMVAFSAPAVKADDDMAPLLRKIAGLVSAIFPKLPAAKLESQYVSSDPEEVKKYNNDPLIYHGKVRARKGYEIMKSMAYILDKFDRITIPALIMHGTADKLTDPQGSQMLYDGISSMDKTIKYYDGFYHEIFNEPKRSEVYANLIEWLDQRVNT